MTNHTQLTVGKIEQIIQILEQLPNYTNTYPFILELQDLLETIHNPVQLTPAKKTSDPVAQAPSKTSLAPETAPKKRGRKPLSAEEKAQRALLKKSASTETETKAITPEVATIE